MSRSGTAKVEAAAILAALLGFGSVGGAAGIDYFVNDDFADAHDFTLNGVCDATAGAGARTLTLSHLPDHDTAQGSLLLMGNGRRSPPWSATRRPGTE